MKKFYFIKDKASKISYDKWALGFSAISIIASFLTVGASVWFYIDTRNATEKFKEQDRNDYYAINSSMIKLDSTYRKNGSPLVIGYGFLLDTLHFKYSLALTNISSYRIDLMFVTFFDENNGMNLINFLEPSKDSVFRKFTVDYSTTNYSLLPGNAIEFTPDMSVTMGKNEIAFEKEINYLILYKNALGGYYAMYYEFILQINKGNVISKQEKTTQVYITNMANVGSNFKIFKTNEFPIIDEKLKVLKKFGKVNKIKLF